jgi:hypothetical protein
MQIRWDRVLAVLAILSFPLVLSWLRHHIVIGRFNDYTLFASVANNTELKGILLLAVLLTGFVLLLKALRG